MAQEQQTDSSVDLAYLEALATNPRFIDAVARRLAEQGVVYKTGE